MSEASNNPAIVGGLAGAAGLFIGAFLSLTTLNTKVADGLDASQGPVAESLAEQNEAIAALTDRLADIESAVAENANSVGSLGEAFAGMGDSVSASVGGIAEQVGGIAEQVGGIIDQVGGVAGAVEGSVTSSVAGLGDQLTELRDSLSAQIDETANAQGEALQTALANLPKPSQIALSPAAEPAAAPAETSSEETVEEPGFVSAGDLGEGGEAFGVGQTAVFLDGAVRAFVQRQDAQAGRAVLSVNGTSHSIGVGESIVVSYPNGSCRVGVSGMSSDGVMILSDCDAPVAADNSGEAAEASSGATAGDLGAGDEAYGVGQTAMFLDGAVRAFVQRQDAEAGLAVLSVNGDSHSINVGESIVARHANGSCRVGVSGMSSDGVMILSDCDASVPNGDLGQAFAPGTTASFADDNLRVFVSGIVNGDARLAVNGLDTQIVVLGEALEIETADSVCTVLVNGVGGNHVAIEGTCN